jgi:multidrug efflux system membrane fusion protein
VTWLVVVALLVAGAVGGYFFYEHQKNAKPPAQPPARPAPVVALPARRQNLPVYLQALGTVTAYNTVNVRTRVDGQLMSVNFQEGDKVEQGQVLAQIDARPFEVQLTQAEGQLARDEASLENAQQDLQRYQAARAAVSQQQIDTAAASVAQFDGAIKTDQGVIANAKLNITYCTITSPITGYIGLRQVDVGNMVHAADANGLAVITQEQPISVLFYLRQEDLPEVVQRMNTGAKLPIEVWDQGPTKKLADGTLETIDNQIDPLSGTARFKAVVANDPRILFPNEFVNVKLLVKTLEGVVTVSSAAVQQGPSGWFVYVVKDGKAEMREVTTGLAQGETTVIEKGVAPGEMVVVNGVDKLHDGAEVTVRQAGESATESGSQPATGAAGAGGRRGGRGGRRGSSASSAPAMGLGGSGSGSGAGRAR